jgi:hypothetical protein
VFGCGGGGVSVFAVTVNYSDVTKTKEANEKSEGFVG